MSVWKTLVSTVAPVLTEGDRFNVYVCQLMEETSVRLVSCLEMVLVIQRLSWQVAELHCRMLGAHLLYENWYKGQPDSYFLSGEDCVVMVWHDDGRWSDVPCNYHLAYTCKKGTSSCGPPPKVQNASIFGKVRQKYETDAVVRFHCAEGFQQRLNPLIRCLSGGRWERPHILCIPEAGGPTQHHEVTSQSSSNSAAIKDFEEFEATKETPQYWEINNGPLSKAFSQKQIHISDAQWPKIQDYNSPGGSL
ncbi:hypothetical protein F7725_025291, partial [Dissostichus mawsoni]